MVSGEIFCLWKEEVKLWVSKKIFQMKKNSDGQFLTSKKIFVLLIKIRLNQWDPTFPY